MDGTPRFPAAMPEEYAERIRRARESSSMKGERRVLTMLFCDVTGSTTMAERLDPEEWAEIIADAFGYMIAPIYTYEGTVARLMGDAILAFFGAPIAHEDDPQRAVLAGLDIVSGIQQFAADMRRDYGFDFNVRVGINTGPVVVGEIGPDLAMEYTALGDAVNLAARMEQTAEPGTVQIAENTYRLVEPFVDVTPLGPLEVKGKEQVVLAYRVDGISSHPGTLRGLEGMESPLVGRETEMGLLRDSVEALVEEGRGQIIFLLGEAGVGKSRLISEVRGCWDDRRTPTDDGWNHWSQTGAVSYGMTQPYGMIKNAIRASCQIIDSDTPEQARAKLAQAVAIYPPDLQQRIYQLFGLLLGIAADASDLAPEGENFKRELLEAMLQATRLRASGSPTVLVSDDIHWSDPASLDELEHTMQLVTEQPVLFLVVMRAEEGSPSWQMKERVTNQYPDRVQEILLSPLSSRESGDLVDSLLPVQDMPPGVRQMILERTDGNPFFIEEVIRALLDSGALVRDKGSIHWNPAHLSTQVAIPGNVQALLAARIDRLEVEARHTLQLASVIGRNFYRRVLDSISETAASLDEQLRELEALALIREAARIPEQEYSFRHALTRDAAYATILRRRRRQFHRRVAEAIEALFPDRLEEESHRLAEHFKEALVLDKAQHYYTMAGDQASRLFANMEAIEHYTKALELAREASAGEQLARLYQRLGRTYEVSGMFDEALALYSEMRDLAEQRLLPELKLQGLLLEATIRSTFTGKFDPARGLELVNEALALARELGDPRAESKAYWNLALLGTYADQGVRHTIEYGQKAAEIARQHRLREELAYALHDLARPFTMVGRIAESHDALNEAAELWRELGRANMLADNRATLSEFLSLQGRLDEALQLSEEAQEISRQASNYWGQSYAGSTRALILFELGLVDEALAIAGESLLTAEKADFDAAKYYMRAHLALNFARLGDLEKAFAQIDDLENVDHGPWSPTFARLPTLVLAYLHALTGNVQEARRLMPDQSDALRLTRTDGILFGTAVAPGILLDLAAGQYEAALSAADDALAVARKHQLLLLLPELLLMKVKALVGLNRLDEAAEYVAEATDRARSSGSRLMLLPALATLVEVEQLRRQETAVSAASQEGQAVVAFIAAHISDDNLRHKFMQLPAVRTLQQGDA